MSFAFLLLIFLIACSPAFLWFDGLAAHGFLAIYLALVLGIIGIRIPPGEAKHFAKLVQPAVLIAAIPAIWMLVQALPLPFAGLAHPIWASAQASLTNSPLGHISISPGATLLSLGRYLLAVGMLFAVAAVCIDRHRAEGLLSWLTFMTVLVSATIIGHDLTGLTVLGEFSGTRRTAIGTAAALGVILSITQVDRVIERCETRRGRPDYSWLTLIEGIAASLIGLFTCSFAVIYFSPAGTKAAVGAGLAVFVLVIAVRRLGLGVWFSAGVGIAALVAFMMLVASQSASTDRDISLRFVQASAQGVDMVERMIADTGWQGSGAGTFTVLQPIYRDDDATALRQPLTAAAALKIELGLVGFWAVIGLASGFIGLLLRGAFRRGRDSFYPTAAASCLVVLVLQGFCNTGPLQTTPTVLSMAILGLGLAQNASRTID